MPRKIFIGLLLAAGFAAALVFDTLNLADQYIAQIIMYIGINIILTVSLNLVNGYMGEFSVGHAAFMAVGAYAASFFSMTVFPQSPAFFPLSLFSGGACAAVLGFLIAVPAFRARDDYL